MFSGPLKVVDQFPGSKYLPLIRTLVYLKDFGLDMFFFFIALIVSQYIFASFKHISAMPQKSMQRHFRCVKMPLKSKEGNTSDKNFLTPF